MKNIQVIDGAQNAAYAIFSATEEEFAAIFPDPGQDIEFIEDLIGRCGDTETGKLMEPIWQRPVPKREVVGIHGTLFYELLFKKKYYENKRGPVIDFYLVDS
jgi:hypothetical protein